MKKLSMACATIVVIVLSSMLVGCSHNDAVPASAMNNMPKDPNAPQSAADIQKEIDNIQKYASIPPAQKQAEIDHLRSQLPPGSSSTP